MERIGTIRSIHRFPVKSMGGEELTQARITSEGIHGDRGWALRDVETDKLVSAKRPRLWRQVLDCTATGAGDQVKVALPGGARHSIADPSLGPALSELLGREVVLEAAHRPQQGTYESDWPEIEGVSLVGEVELPTNLTGEGTSFVDLGVLHLITTASLDALASAGPDLAVDVRRFRPSFVIETVGAEPWAENEWEGTTLAIGESLRVTVGIPTPRCVMTTVEQPGLDRQPEVLQTLARVNRREVAVGGFACLGSYASVAGEGTIEVGDPVRIER